MAEWIGRHQGQLLEKLNARVAARTESSRDTVMPPAVVWK